MLKGVDTAITARLSDRVAVCVVGKDESSTFTVKVSVPGAVNVPSIWPVAAFKVKPLGRTPERIDQVYGVVPPVADRVVEYIPPTLPAGMEVVDICNAGLLGVMFIDKDCVAVCWLGADESVTSTTKLESPGVVGIPEIVPLAASESPKGSDPELRLNV
jgi:hypothetical protein